MASANASPVDALKAADFDPEPVEGLIAIMAREEVDSLLRDLARELRTRLALLERRAADPDALAEVKSAAHDLKSMSGNFGLMRLSALAGRVEAAARAGDAAGAAAAAPALAAHGAVAVSAFCARYGVEDPGARRSI